MGDRVSISFKRGDDESVALFNHWGGMEFVDTAEMYVRKLKRERSGSTKPLDRFEPCIVMVDFVRDQTNGMDRVESSLYLGADKTLGDNSDNGHHVIDLDKE